MFLKDETGVCRCDAFERLDWLEHGFGTRHSADWPSPPPVASLRQIHSDRCLIADGLDGCAGEADALIASRPGQWVSVRTADCLPLFIVATRPRVVAAVHAGWRGTTAAIAAKTVRTVSARFSAHPEEMTVAIGPGIGACCYEVGPEVVERFREILPGLPSEGKAKLDLVRANVMQLVAAGVPEDRILADGQCTFCAAEDFYSYRRAPGEGGRMVSAIRIRPTGSN